MSSSDYWDKFEKFINEHQIIDLPEQLIAAGYATGTWAEVGPNSPAWVQSLRQSAINHGIAVLMEMLGVPQFEFEWPEPLLVANWLQSWRGHEIDHLAINEETPNLPLPLHYTQPTNPRGNQ